ncbi:MAG: type II secretion system minor pseudopilin GspI [Mariprofundaceae bacterium]|nr:type II secretion system minor pseudopilin GspI [Mariprofundaceae bacterium]
MKKAGGFTLIEALVALAIASFALVALMGRMGASADIQGRLSLHALSIQTARNILAEDRLQTVVSGTESQGELITYGVPIVWRLWTEKTLLDGFVRRNVAVTADHDPEVRLFMYRAQ